MRVLKAHGNSFGHSDRTTKGSELWDQIGRSNCRPRRLIAVFSPRWMPEVFQPPRDKLFLVLWWPVPGFAVCIPTVLLFSMLRFAQIRCQWPEDLETQSRRFIWGKKIQRLFSCFYQEMHNAFNKKVLKVSFPHRKLDRLPGEVMFGMNYLLK